MNWANVAGPEVPERPRLTQALPVVETKPRLVHDARPHNVACGKATLSMDTVAWVALVAPEG